MLLTKAKVRKAIKRLDVNIILLFYQPFPLNAASMALLFIYIVIPSEFLVKFHVSIIIPPFVKGRLGGIYIYKNPPQSPFFKGGSRN